MNGAELGNLALFFFAEGNELAGEACEQRKKKRIAGIIEFNLIF